LRGGPLPEPPSPAEQRSALLAEAADVVRVEWTATDDPAARGAGGDVVWSNARQQGWLRLRGLAVNDPTREQYQLWIFDATRDERHPVDGGVFDVDSATGDVLVPIRAAVPVAEPTLFAVTVERPGGVVVSSRERLPLLAKLGG
jgi:anti-sigma-K factor RskA